MDEKNESLEDAISNSKPKSPPIEDDDFEPSAEMMIHDFDDETTLNDDENDLETSADELADLAKEGEMPLEELMALYYNARNETEEDDKDDPTNWTTDAAENDETKQNTEEQSNYKEEQSTRRSLRSTSVLNATASDSDSSDDGEESALHEYEWKKPRVGDEYQVTEIPDKFAAPCDTSPHEEDQQVWMPWNIPQDLVEQYLKQVASYQDDSSLPSGSHVQDNEDALFLLTQCKNNPEEALKRYKSRPSPLRSELCIWSEDECKQFELGLTSYGKDFYHIHLNKVRTKSVRDIIKFYYIWKKSERYDHFTAKTRLGKKKDSLNPGVTDYMDRLLDETDRAATSSVCHGSSEFLKYPPVTHSNALKEHLHQMQVAQIDEAVGACAENAPNETESYKRTHDEIITPNEAIANIMSKITPQIMTNNHGDLQLNNSNNTCNSEAAETCSPADDSPETYTEPSKKARLSLQEPIQEDISSCDSASSKALTLKEDIKKGSCDPASNVSRW